MTMSALGGPPEEIGKKVAAALVGTFLGILMCYGFIGPIAANLAKLAHEEHEYLHVLRVTHDRFHERDVAAAGGGDGTARRSRASAPDLRGIREALQAIRRRRAGER